MRNVVRSIVRAFRRDPGAPAPGRSAAARLRRYTLAAHAAGADVPRTLRGAGLGPDAALVAATSVDLPADRSEDTR